MTNLLNPLALLGATVLFLTPVSKNSRSNLYHPISFNKQQSDAATLNELNVLASKHLRAAALAEQNGGQNVRLEGEKLGSVLNVFNDELRALAKKKSIVLTNGTPEGGQRPDGRIDSSPENLRDTSRIKNGGGEAGNSGVEKPGITAANDAGNNALVAGLKKLKGDAFDQAWHNLLLSDRVPVTRLLQKVAKSSDSEISKFGQKYVALLNSAGDRKF